MARGAPPGNAGMTSKTTTLIVLFVIGVLALPIVLQKINEKGPPPVTREKYDLIMSGMTYRDVVEVLGREGIPINMTIEEARKQRGLEGHLYINHPNSQFQAYGWKNKKGKASGSDTRIFVFFIDGRVAGKKQIGLDAY